MSREQFIMNILACVIEIICAVIMTYNTVSIYTGIKYDCKSIWNLRNNFIGLGLFVVLLIIAIIIRIDFKIT